MINCCRFEHFSGFPETAAQFCLSGLSFTSATVPQGVGQSQIHFASRMANVECYFFGASLGCGRFCCGVQSA